MQGKGKMTWATSRGKKNIYKGQFLANVFHGSGILNLANGDYYQGQFENGKFSGEGYYKWISQPRLYYKGEFKNGKLHGTGTLQNMNGVFQGQFKKGFLDGKVIINFQFGDKYIGEYQESAMTGYGSYTFNDGTKITGYFENGVCNKHGKKVYPDGRIYIGEFRNDIENGKGVLIWGERKISGIWKDAQLVQELIQQSVNNNSKSEEKALSLLMENRPDSVAKSMGIDVLDVSKLNA